MVCWEWYLIIGDGVGMGCTGCAVVADVVHTIHTQMSPSEEARAMYVARG